MKRFIRGHPLLSLLILVAGVFLLVVGGFGYYLADTAGKLPWQEEPTRISEAIVPFSGLFGTPVPTGIATGTPTP